jgi:predicted transcriptional regulator
MADSRHTRIFSPIGSLESEILLTTEDHSPATVRDVYESLRLKRPIAYTTCITVMGTLVRKGFLSVDKRAATYRYRPRRSAEQLGRQLIDMIVTRLWAGERGAALGHLLGVPHALSHDQVTELACEAQRLTGDL